MTEKKKRDQLPPPPPFGSAAVRAWIFWLAKLLVLILGGAAGGVAVWPAPAPREKLVEVERAVPVPDAFASGAEHVETFGWVKDADQVAENLDPARTLHFAATPAGRAVMGDGDVYLWQMVRKAAGRPAPWYPNVNQQSVGCCVGCGWKHSVDVCQAAQIVQGKKAEWKPVSVEVIYGGSRVEVGGARLSGDGSVGAWAAKWVREWGVVPMEKFPSVDLSTFSPTRARTFGRKGVSKDLEAIAKEHPVKNTALVKSFADVGRAIRQGYPVAVCSDQGFTMERDKDGFARASGTWNHCMAIIGVRGGARPGAFILNSWGDNAHTGPVWPADAPVAGFWADADVVDRMVRQGDSFALSELVGFPARDVKPDWFVLAPPRPRPDWARLDRGELAEGFALLFALAP